MIMITRKAGEVFVSRFVKYQAIESKDGIGCDKCCFGSSTEQGCVLSESEWPTFGLCGAEQRSDNKDVYFKRIGEITEDNK